jgi:cytochrome c oxidase assembly protein subunit 11
MSTAAPPPGNLRTGLIACLGALAMLGVGYAAVPLYRIFCQKTGYGGTPARLSEAEAKDVRVVPGQSMSIRFDANVDPGMQWRFGPEANTRTVAIGARSLAFFDAENLSDHAITGTASYNIEPDTAARYFTKIQCFCFTSQTLAPHQKVRMPVLFFVDPAILEDPDNKGLEQITLSYTFHVSKRAS